MHLLDANAFMEASRLYYSFQIAPRYWEWLVDKFNEGEIASVEAVYDEITAGTGLSLSSRRWSITTTAGTRTSAKTFAAVLL